MRIRVLTQNMYNGRGDPRSFAGVLRTHKPDVVAVQELSANAAQVLAEWGEATLLDPRDDTTGMGMAIRGDARLEQARFPFRNPMIATLSPGSWGPGPDLQIVNIHLVNPISRPILGSRDLRRQELAALGKLAEGASDGEALLLVGDFNSSPAWPLYRRLKGPFTDGAVAAGTARRTWGPWPSSPRLLRIDHAFVRGPVRVVATRTVKVEGADHRGLLVDIEST